MTSGEFFLTVLLTIVILVIIAYIIWRFFFVHNGNKTGEFCTTDDDCVAGNYCGGGTTGGQCVAGKAGKKEGTICVRNAECEVGLLCGQDASGVSRCLKQS